MELRKLDPAKDAVLVARLFLQSADFVRLTEGVDPGPPQVAQFFKGVPPGGDLADSLKLGLFDGPVLLGIADLGYGYPEPDDAYIGLMLFAPAFGGQGLGERFLAAYRDLVLGHGATRIVLGVLHNNPRARAFWTRLGFQVDKADVTVRHGRLADRLALNISQLPSVDGPGS